MTGLFQRLDLLLESQKIGAREGKTLDTLYTSIPQEAFGDDGPEDDAKTPSVICAVVLAMNPLSPSAVATLLRFDTADAHLFACLSGVTEVNRIETQECAFSSSAYLVSGERSGRIRFGLKLRLNWCQPYGGVGDVQINST